MMNDFQTRTHVLYYYNTSFNSCKRPYMPGSEIMSLPFYFEYV